MSFFRLLRITALLTLLIIVAGSQWITHSRIGSWDKPVWMTIYPVIADSNRATRSYVASLGAESFSEVGAFLAGQAGRYGQTLSEPLMLQFAPVLDRPPPPVPPENKRLAIALWSLKMRWWAWRREREDGLPGADIQMFILYRANVDRRELERSVGVRKGMFGIVNAYASRAQAPRNRIVLAHELLHVLGASDKYDLSTGQPHVPEGLAEPERRPVYPQDLAEIMGGRIALSPDEAVIPRSLRACLIGPVTAAEIGWL